MATRTPSPSPAPLTQDRRIDLAITLLAPALRIARIDDRGRLWVRLKPDTETAHEPPPS